MTTILFTVGYEGRSIDAYINLLLEHNIKLLADVRFNPLSRKKGFSKKRLHQHCEEAGIAYRHFPELGIPGVLRKDHQMSMELIFEHYRNNILPAAGSALLDIFSLLKQFKRIALTCFEADVNHCHRKYLAEELAKLPGFDYKVEHI